MLSTNLQILRDLVYQTPQNPPIRAFVQIMECTKPLKLEFSVSSHLILNKDISIVVLLSSK